MNDLRHDPDDIGGVYLTVCTIAGAPNVTLDCVTSSQPSRTGISSLEHREIAPDISDEMAAFATPPPVRTVYADLRTADQRHADDLAALRAEIDDIKATLHKQAQMVQVLWLAHELRERTL